MSEKSLRILVKPLARESICDTLAPLIVAHRARDASDHFRRHRARRAGMDIAAVTVSNTLRTRLPRPQLVAAAGIALLALGACSENRPFERESAGAQTRLAVPASLTPPIAVHGVAGAPTEWKLAERVAEALRSRDIPASAAMRSRSAYVLKGEMRPGAERNGRSRVEVVWNLYDGLGKKVGEVTQMAAVPGAAFKAPNEGVVEAMADAAAESIAPLVPSSSLQLADGVETGERRGNDRARIEERDRVTGVGKMPATTGVARNLLAAPKREVKVVHAPAKPAPRTAAANTAAPKSATPYSATPPAARYSATPPTPDRNAITAVGRYQGESALSRNLLRTGQDPAKPLPRPQRAAPPPPSQPAMREGLEAEESLSLSAVPEPASDTRRRGAPARAMPPQHAEAPVPRTDVAERPRQIAESPAPRREAAPERPAAPVQYAERPARGGYQFWIQVGSHKDEGIARAEWQKIQGAASSVVVSAGNRIQRADLGTRGVYYRIQIGPFASQGEAGQLCAQLRARSIECFLAPPERATASVRPPEEAPAKPAMTAPQPKPAAKPAEPKPVAKPADVKPVAKPAEPMPAAKAQNAKPLAKPAEAKPAPAEKPREAAAVPKKPEAEAPALPEQKPEARPPRNSSAEKPDAPLSTAPGLPGVLD
jgi:hypothetical protein